MTPEQSKLQPAKPSPAQDIAPKHVVKHEPSLREKIVVAYVEKLKHDLKDFSYNEQVDIITEIGLKVATLKAAAGADHKRPSL